MERTAMVKSLAWGLAIVAAVGVLVGAPLLALRAQRGVHCRDHVVIVNGRRGAPIECVCIDGVLATCFEPGP